MSVDASTLEDDRRYRNYSPQVCLHVPEPIPISKNQVRARNTIIRCSFQAEPHHPRIRKVSQINQSRLQCGSCPEANFWKSPLPFRFNFWCDSQTTELHINREVEIKFKTKSVPSEYTHRLFSQFLSSAETTRPTRKQVSEPRREGSVSHMPCLRHEPLFRPEF